MHWQITRSKDQENVFDPLVCSIKSIRKRWKCKTNHFQIDAFFFSSSSILVPKLLAKGYCAHSRRRNKCAKKCKEEDKKVSKISTVMTSLSCVILTIFTINNIDPQKFPPPFQMENQSEAKRISVPPSFWSKKPQSSSLWWEIREFQREPVQ